MALLFWDLFYMGLYVCRIWLKGEIMDDFVTMAYRFIFFRYNGFMWFFVPLILIYMSLPFVAQFILNSSRRLLRSFLIIGLFLSFIPPIQADLTSSSVGDVYLMGSRFLYFIVAGYYLGNYEISRRMRKRIYLLAVVSMLVMFLGTMLLTLNVPAHYKYFLSYTNAPCTVSAMGVFLFFKYTRWGELLSRLGLSGEWLARYSGLSLGIYFIQAAWFMILGLLHLCDNHIILRFFVMYVLCAFSVWVMKRIPLVNRFVP